VKTTHLIFLSHTHSKFRLLCNFPFSS
jgi:hypothetical protein